MGKSGVIIINNILKKVCCVIFSVALVFSVLSFNAFALTDEEEAASLQNKIDSLESQIKNGTASNTAELDKLEAIQKQIDVYNKQKDELDTQISENNKNIENFQSNIDFLQKDIDEANSNIDEQNQNIQIAYAALAERMRATYIAGETSTLEVLLTSHDYETFLTRLELTKRIAEHDHELVNNFKDAVVALNDTKERIVSNKAEQEQQKAEKEQTQADTIAKSEEQTRLIEVTTQKQQECESIIQSNDTSIGVWKERLDAAKDDYDEVLSGMGSTGSGSLPTQPPTTQAPTTTEKPTEKPTNPGGGGNTETPTETPTEPPAKPETPGGSEIGNYPISAKGMIRPLQYSNVYISAGWYGYPNHKGIDFCTRGATGNTYGKEIRAAADGVVLSAEYHYSWGYNVYIDHGNGVKTRYAHTSQMLVSVGQKVKQGQVIAYVGNTGNVSPKPTAANPHAGAHLHFEVWINGDRVNPTPWLP